MKKYEIKLDRRNFLKKSTMVGLASIAPGLFFKEFADSK
ncbi:MAG: twin-arginine translocation signal domain-containing protein [Gammaproteobacteria bacterium]